MGPLPDSIKRDWRAALDKLAPDDGEQFASREEEEQVKRRRARDALAQPDPPAADPNPEPCADCPQEATG
jgi:hypothetical protein